MRHPSNADASLAAFSPDARLGAQVAVQGPRGQTHRTLLARDRVAAGSTVNRAVCGARIQGPSPMTRR